MKNLIFYILIIQLAMNSCSKTQKTEEILHAVKWHGQACISVNHQGYKIYIDPYQLQNADSANLILITHPHSDHCSASDAGKISTSSTIVIAPELCLSKLEGVDYKEFIISKPGFEHNFGKINIKAVPAYNVVKTSFHNIDNGWVGYIIEIDGVKIYHTGDTERIPEMKNITCDIVLVPLGQVYTMNSVDEAAMVCSDVKAAFAIPIHYGMYEGTLADAEKFRELAGNYCTVIIKKIEPN